jgi:putative SOS response-associated peptidase YedK
MLAGLWDHWKDPEGDSELDTYTVVTVNAAGIPAQIHNTKLRMPLILGRESCSLWLDETVRFSECAPEMAPVFRMLTAWPVSRDVSLRNVVKNRPDIQEIAEYPGLPPLVPL